MAVQASRHIALIGFMGCGKSTVGPLLAKRLGLPFADIDRIIEEQVGATIPEIFAREGEQAFRRYETRALKSVLRLSPRVVATGGGLVVADENWSLLTAKTLPVWLRVPVEQLLDRIRTSTDRPLLQNDPGLVRTRALYQAREPLYERAPLWVDANRAPREVVQDIVDCLAAVDDWPRADRDEVRE